MPETDKAQNQQIYYRICLTEKSGNNYFFINIYNYDTLYFISEIHIDIRESHFIYEKIVINTMIT